MEGDFLLENFKTTILDFGLDDLIDLDAVGAADPARPAELFSSRVVEYARAQLGEEYLVFPDDLYRNGKLQEYFLWWQGVGMYLEK